MFFFPARAFPEEKRESPHGVTFVNIFLAPPIRRRVRHRVKTNGSMFVATTAFAQNSRLARPLHCTAGKLDREFSKSMAEVNVDKGKLVGHASTALSFLMFSRPTHKHSIPMPHYVGDRKRRRAIQSGLACSAPSFPKVWADMWSKLPV